MLRLLLICIFSPLSAASFAQDTEEPVGAMTVSQLARIIVAMDADARQRGPAFEFTVQDIPATVITDPQADRMRAMVPIRSAEGLAAEELMRLMEANFASALDARYAVAHGRLWGVFIHPLSPLEPGQFVSGIAQTVNVALTYGQTYSGGSSVFGGGDSANLHRQVLEKLKREGQEL
ncbi:MAG: hypothetical protein PVI41_02995 [Roseobacter sp.]|jgi:hypothetical protein